MSDFSKNTPPALDQCLSKDRHRFRRRMAQLAKSPDRKKQQALNNAMQASADLLKQRANIKPQLQWPDLPVCDRLEDLKTVIDDNQVVVIAGETGSGKTTQLPKICLALGRGIAGMIGHTQPRRLAARAVANRLAEEMACQVGQEVGVQVRFQDSSTDLSLIKVMTDGILLAEIQQDPFLNRYDTLIIDEAHERSLNIDFLLGYLKTLLVKRKDLKLIITSATIDVERFSKHFSINGKPAPVVEVSGRSYPVTVHYRPPEPEQDISRQLENVLHEIEQEERKNGRLSACDVLVFLSGERDIRDAHHHLRRAQFRDAEFLPLYARLSRQEQNRIFQPHRGRRVVLATNVAETSLTVPGIRYVIDAGTARISRYSVQSKVQRLPIEAISQASANQRAGRCGRIMAGDCFRLYEEDDFHTRPEFTDAEIRRTNLAAVILRMADLGLGDVEKFPFIDPPEGKVIRDGYRLLSELGAVKGQRLTRLGKQLARLPLDPRLGRMLLAANSENALREMLMIVSALAVQDPRERPQDAQQQADQAHQPFIDKQSDFLFFVNLWHWAEKQREDLSRNQYEKLLKKTFLSPMRMREWRETHTQLLLLCKELKLTINKEPASYKQIHCSLLPGLLDQVMRRTDEGEWLSARNRKPMLWPGSAVKKSKSRWLLCAEQVETSRLFARTLAQIEPEWVERAAQHLLKRSWHEPYWAKKRGCVMAKEQVHLFGLLLSSGRRVNYGPIDPVLSLEMLVREGLVVGELNKQPDFVVHNLALIKQLEDMEARLRRRDLIADEEQQLQFYRARLPDKVGDKPLVSITDLMNWYGKHASDAEKKALLMDEAFLLQKNDDLSALGGFPDQLDCDGTLFPLRYQFDPQGHADGVTVICPLPLLPKLAEQQLAWLVPGLLPQKLEALIRGLPKNRRRNFVPVPNYVQALMAGIRHGQGDLFEKITQELQRMTGVRIEREEWLEVNLDTHLKCHIEVLDQGKVVLKGDDLSQLKDNSPEPAVVIDDAADQPDKQAPKPFNTWPEDLLLDQVVQSEQSGVTVRLFPALTLTEKGVRLASFPDQHQADFSHVNAMSSLVLSKLAVQHRQLRQHWRKVPAWQAALADKDLGGAGLLDAALRCHVRLHFDLTANIRGKQSFDEVVKAGAGNWLQAAEAWLVRWQGVFEQRQVIVKKLKKNFPLAWAHAHSDLLDQLNGLFMPDFFSQVPQLWLAEYGRYLKAIEERLDKIGGRLNQDRAWVAELKEWQERYQLRAAGRPLWQQPEPLQVFRFMLEEFRVSLFAQQLGTKMPVSSKRLRQQWEQC